MKIFFITLDKKNSITLEAEEETKLLPYIEFENCQCTKAELLQECISYPHPFICQIHFSNEKAGNQKD